MGYKELIDKGSKYNLDRCNLVSSNLALEYQKHYKRLSDKDIEVIKSYTLGFRFRGNNSYTRYLDKVLKTPKTERSLILYRGTSISKIAETVKGEFDKLDFETLYVYSFTLNPFIARRFALIHQNIVDFSYLILELELPINYSALYLEPLSLTSGEYEFIIGSGNSFEIIDVEDGIDYEDRNYNILKIKPMRRK